MVLGPALVVIREIGPEAKLICAIKPIEQTVGVVVA